MIQAVCDKNVPLRIHRDPPRRKECSQSRTDIVAGKANLTIPRDRADVAACNLSDPVVRRVGDINITASVDRHAGGKVQCGGNRSATVSAESSGSAGNSRNHAGGDSADSVVSGIGDV